MKKPTIKTWRRAIQIGVAFAFILIAIGWKKIYKQSKIQNLILSYLEERMKNCVRIIMKKL